MFEKDVLGVSPRFDFNLCNFLTREKVMHLIRKNFKSPRKFPAHVQQGTCKVSRASNISFQQVKIFNILHIELHGYYQVCLHFIA